MHYFISDYRAADIQANFGRKVGSKDKKKRKPINIGKQAKIGAGIGAGLGGLGTLASVPLMKGMPTAAKVGIGLANLGSGAARGAIVGAGQAAIRKKIRVDKGKEKWKSGYN